MDYRDYIEKDRGGRSYSLKQEGRDLLEGIVSRDDQTDRLVDFAETFGGFLADTRERGALSTSQIRNIFGEVKQIEMGWERNPEASWARLQLLRPKLAYVAAKENSSRLRALQAVMTTALLAVEGSAENFRRFVDFFEAVLAYHRAAGGS